MTSTSFTMGGREIILETGEIARQAQGAVVVRSGKALVLVAVAAAALDQREEEFFPLTVEYREKRAAVGRIPGGILRREGRTSDYEVLVSRLIDRSIRPLFPKGLGLDVQVLATVFSGDPDELEAPILALIGAGAALHLSAVPWLGPAAGVRVAEIGRRLVTLPAPKIRRGADLDLVVSARPEGLIMVEGGARQVNESRVMEALAEAQSALEPCFDAFTRLREAAGKEKLPVSEPIEHPVVATAVSEWAEARLKAAFALADKKERRDRIGAVIEDAVVALAPGDVDQAQRVRRAVRALKARLARELALEGQRLDGRSLTEIRPIAIKVGWLPSAHGSSVFTRGQTQAITSCTLGSSESRQAIETLSGFEHQRFLLHYNFPPYSVGEVRALRGPGRREIGHGALAQRALEAVLPSFESFPYAIRVEADITESNGSSSMATVCGGSLSLMDAGVPISEHVSGIAMGLVAEGDRFVVLSDILGDEDHLGDMDLKVAGTGRGIVAIQMDNKMGSLPADALKQALDQAKEGRLAILATMVAVLPAPRPELAPGAPRAFRTRVPSDAIGLVIGPRGANVKALKADFGVEIDVAEDGLVSVFAPDAATGARALARIRDLAGLLEVGKLYRGRITAVKDFGAFVKIHETAEGLVHISEWDRERIENLGSVAREGDVIVVRVLGVDQRGKVRLSRKEALEAGGETIENEVVP